MTAWILVAAIGGVLSILGLLVLTRRYLRGEMSQWQLFAIIVGYVSLCRLYLLVPFALNSLAGL